MEVVCFFSGVACFYFKNGYALVLLCVVLFFRPRLLFCLCFGLGFFYAFLHEAYTAPRGIPDMPVISKADITGVVTSVPVITPDKTQFELSLTRFHAKPAHAKLLLSCYQNCPSFHIGEVWQLEAKLKKPQNLGNPGGFNAVQAYQARHIRWVGTLAPDASEYLGEYQSVSLLLTKMRGYLAQKLEQQSLQPGAYGIVKALTLGFGSDIHQASWELFRRTGTTHLMVISGAHIGLVAGLTYALVKLLWVRLGRMALKIPAQRVASLAALAMALVYSVLAGFGVPAQRALIVCFFMLLRHIGPCAFSVWQAYRYALFFVLLFEPHAVLMPGFYLSFGAVAVLLIANQIIHAKGIQKMLFMQLACLIGLMPLTLFLFGYGALNGFFANLIAIPWVGFLLIPMALLMVFLGPFFSLEICARMLQKLINGLIDYLTWIDQLKSINLDTSLGSLFDAVLLILAFALMIILPIRLFLPASAVLLVSSLSAKQPVIHEGEAEIDVLDVAQGLSVVVQTAHHKLVYDTGMKFYRGSDMGQLALIPYLKTRRTRALDMVVISHPDLDHRGGLSSLQSAYAVHRLLVDDPTFYHEGLSCHQYSPWQWDGVLFEFLPLSLNNPKTNNRSCVLKITTDFGSMLLTGDIEHSAEYELIDKYKKQLKTAVLLVPHHQSKTSSSSRFLEATKPEVAIASYGFDNRYHFPHHEATSRYETAKIPVYATEQCGLIQVFLSHQHQFNPVFCTKYHKN